MLDIILIITKFFTGYILISILYNALFAWGSLFSRKKKINVQQRREALDRKQPIAILIPAYKEDSIIIETVKNILSQEDLRKEDKIVVIADHLKDSTLEVLASFPICVLKADFEKSTKAKALNLAINNLDENYTMALVLDADNRLRPGFLNHIRIV